MSGFEGSDDWAALLPEEKRSDDRYDLGISGGYDLSEMSLVKVDGGIRLNFSYERDRVSKILTPGMARIVGKWMLDNSRQGHEKEERHD